MIDNTTTITKWNRFSDWRDADISKTNVLDSIKLPATCFLSANAYGLKGKFPGGKHTWVATFDGNRWKTFEITDRETIDIQNAMILYADRDNYIERQLIVSDRDPSTMWFGNQPRLDRVYEYVNIDPSKYPNNDNINLVTNNCSTFLSYISWKHRFFTTLPYIGYKRLSYWDNLRK
jgi:hypothetical protein